MANRAERGLTVNTLASGQGPLGFNPNEGFAMYLVSDSHGNRDTFHTLEMAREYAKSLMAFYETGGVGNDPKPSIMELRSIERYFYDKEEKKTVCVDLT